MAYTFQVAKVVDTAKTSDDRLKVRVLPQMEGIPESSLPLWSSFFRDSQYTGNINDYVWVICDEEYSNGYIFGLANYTSYPDRADVYTKSVDKINLSIPSDLITSINDSYLKLEGNYFSLENSKITYWDDNCIHYTERSTGGEVIAFRNGTLYIMRPDKFTVKIGNSAVTLSSEGISMSSKDVKIQGDYVGLGKNATMNVMINDGKSAEGAVKSKTVYA